MNRELAVELCEPELGLGLVTRDARAARAFYCDVLGFEDATGVLLAGRHRIELLERPAAPRRDAGIYDAAGIRVLAVFVDDLDAVIGRIRGTGRKIADGRGLPGRLRITFAKDADGNMLELIGLPEPAGAALPNRLQIGLTVADAEVSRRFYGGVLGLPEQPPVPIGDGLTRYSFSAGRTTLKLWSPRESTNTEIPRGAGPPDDAIGFREIRFCVAEPDVVCAAAASLGAGIAVAPQDALGGGRTAVVRDPDGNWLRFSTPR